MMLFRFMFLAVLLLPLKAYPDIDTEPKNINLGIGYYSLQIYRTKSDEVYSYDSDKQNGVSLSAAYMLSNKVAFRGIYYSLNHGNFADTDVTGLDALAYYGNGMAIRGFKWYIGGGYFSEEWNVAAQSYTANGLQLSGGLGYNWQRYAFDMLLNFRDPGDYDEYLAEPGVDINTAGVLMLMMSARF